MAKNRLNLALPAFLAGVSMVLLIPPSIAGGESYMKMFAAQQSPVDPCFDEDRPRRCIPDFVNAAFGTSVEASSTCGSGGPTRYCDVNELAGVNGPVGTGQCHVCDDSTPRKRFPPSYLTDLNNPNNITCWRSEPLVSSQSFSAPPDNVTLTLSLGKKYELTYVSLQFCPKAAKPDSIAIYKSMDYGKTWQPFQFYSSQCRRVYGRPNRATITKANEQEARCTDSHRYTGGDGLGPVGRIAFSTLEGRPSAPDFDNSPVLQDWVTATDIKVVFNRLHMPHGQDDFPNPEEAHNNEDATAKEIRKDVQERSKSSKNQAKNQLIKGSVQLEQDVQIGATVLPSVQVIGPQDMQSNDALDADVQEMSFVTTTVTTATTTTLAHHYAVSDFAVGGRCKCNGHAARCVPDKDGEVSCECRHNTAGRDCERCRPFHFDRPWARATAKDANECKACNCNLHARRCRFNMELYKLSGRVSGGVCLQCRHSTAGRHCHYCREGYYRDPARPITHRKACKPCDCHPIGASGKTCNQSTGQCPCKDGVTGIMCNRCARGYQQSRSHIAPCIKIPKVVQTQGMAGEDSGEHDETEQEHGYDGRADQCGKCRAGTRRLNLNKYCKRDFAIMGKVTDRHVENGASNSGSAEWVRFTIQVQSVYKRARESRLRRGPMTLYIHAADLACKCPKVKANKSYLILGRENDGGHQGALTATQRSIVIEWRDEWHRRMRRFQRRARSCH
ncbi:netrin-A-like isoform X1 [Athalia rosae]|uniref:netrin-A-like isoform X1 n=1 Tax=Athalia rosae TaxID=37344 RepID=UPI0020346785|nr:netrin-A-like isoform X1 [Athalia rosae]XP_048514934.1 netrin-A-like isoform X1 [Athalia rosae]